MGNLRLYFRTRGGHLQGWGNIYRLSSFAKYCGERLNCESRFFAEGPREVAAYLEQEGFPTTQLAEDISIQDEGNVFAKYPKAHYIFMEMLDSSYERQSSLKKFCDKLVVFDDLADHIYCADIVVAGQDLPGLGNIALSAKRAKYLTGSKYFPLRPEFAGYADKKRTYKKNLESILVAFGGGNYDAAYLKTARALSAMSGRIKVKFVIGNSCGKDLAYELKQIMPRAEVISGADNIDALLWQSDFALVSAGYLKFEAAATKTPFAMVATQYHQIPLAEGFNRKARAPYLGYISYFTEKDVIHAVNSFWKVEKRFLLGERVHKSIDGRGMERVFKEIFGPSRHAHI